MLFKSLALKSKAEGVINKALIFGGFGLVVVSVFTISFLAPKGNMGSSQQMLELASYLPENTLLFANLNLSQEKFDLLNKVSGNSLTSENIIKSLQEASKDQSDQMDIKNLVSEFNKTLEPKATLGVWTDQNKSENVLITTLLKDKTSVESFIKNLSADKTITFKKEMVDGVEVNIGNNDKEGSYAVINNTLIIGNKLDTVKQAIANHKSNKNFLKTNNINTITSKLPNNPFSTIIFNAGGLTEMAKNLKTGTPSENEKMDQINQVTDSMSYSGLGIDINDDVLVVKSYTPLNLQSVKNEELKNKINEIINTTNKLDGEAISPADSFIMLSIGGLSKVIDTYILTLKEKEKMQFVQSKTFISMMTGGMDFDKEILPIISNELTISATFNDKTPNPVISLTNSTESLAVVEKLAKIITMQDPQSKISQKDIGNNKINVISFKPSPVDFAFGSIGNMIVLSTAPVVEKIAQNPNSKADSLSENPLYKDLKSKIDYKPSFVLFINMEKFAQFLKANNMDPKNLQGIENLEKSIDGIFVSAANEKDQAVIGSLLVKMKTAK